MRIEIYAFKSSEKGSESWCLPHIYTGKIEDCKRMANNAIDKKILPLKKYEVIKVCIFDPKLPRGHRLVDKWEYRPTYRD